MQNGNGLWIESVRDAGSAKPCAGGVDRHLDRRGDGERQGAQPGTTVTTVKLKIPSSFTVTVANHGNCPVRGISVHLTEGNQKTQISPSSRCCRTRP